MSRPIALYFYPGESTFVNKDIVIISELFEIKKFNFRVEANRKWKIFPLLFKQFLFLLRHCTHTKITITQFAGYHSFLPVLFSMLFRQKSLIIAGGNECASFPSIGYGNYQKKYLAKFTTWSLRHCSMIAPKHETMWQCRYTYSDKDFPEQGIAYFIPGIKTPYTIIHNGYDAEQIRPAVSEKNIDFLTVTGALEYPFQSALKGIDLILDAAKCFPEYNFTIVGAISDHQFAHRTKNVSLLPRLSHDEVIRLYHASRFYFQLSMAEGFPNALCEAMLCECIPVGSEVFSIPDIIGDSGYILRKRDSNLLIELIRTATSDNDLGKGIRARNRIIECYSLERRKTELQSLLKKIIA